MGVGLIEQSKAEVVGSNPTSTIFTGQDNTALIRTFLLIENKRMEKTRDRRIKKIIIVIYCLSCILSTLKF
jgi:hypothetical protein